MKRHLTLLACVATVACNYGTRPKDFAPASSPQGALVALRVQGESVDRIGELLSADSSGVTLGTGSVSTGVKPSVIGAPPLSLDGAPAHAVHIAWARIAAMDVYKMGSDVDVLHGERLSPEKRARIALVSRFPQGLSADLLAAVLKHTRQNALEEIK